VQETRISNAISVAKIVAMGLIVSVNYFSWLFNGMYGVEYQYALSNFIEVMNKNEFILDKIAFVSAYVGWSGVVMFVILSGCSLWLSRIKKGFNLISFIKDRITGFYFPYLLAVAISFIGFTVVNTIRPTYSIESGSLLALIMCGADYNINAQLYNTPLWFASVIVALYFIYPFIVFLHEKYGAKGILVVILLLFLPVIFIGNFPVVTSPLLRFLVLFCCGILAVNMLIKYDLKIISIVCTSISIPLIVYFAYIQPQQEPVWVVNNTFAVGILATVVFLAIGYYLPVKWNKVLRWLSRGTFTVFLYHYLLIHIISPSMAMIPSLSLALLLAYGTMLVGGSFMQGFVDKKVSQYITPLFNKTILTNDR